MTTTPARQAMASGRDFRWDITVFKVEDRIFRVNRHALVQHSEVFEGMYLLPSTGEGTTDDNPIELHGYKAADFEALLMVLYPTMEDTISGGFPLTKEQWIGVLRVTRPWEMHRIRKLVIKALSGASFVLGTVEKIKLARDHKVSAWLVEGLVRITQQQPKLSSDELEQAVGLRSAFRLVKLQVESFNQSGVSSIKRACEFYTGLSMAALRCPGCTASCLPNPFSCHSCSKMIHSEEASTFYIDSETAGPNVTSSGNGVHLSFPLYYLVCQSCGNWAVTRSISCKSCSYHFNINGSGPKTLVLARFGHPAAPTEEMIRSTFKDEIEEYDA